MICKSRDRNFDFEIFQFKIRSQSRCAREKNANNEGLTGKLLLRNNLPELEPNGWLDEKPFIGSKGQYNLNPLDSPRSPWNPHPKPVAEKWAKIR